MYFKGEYEFFCCGARARTSAKGIEVLSEPLVEYCPFMKLCMV